MNAFVSTSTQLMSELHLLMLVLNQRSLTVCAEWSQALVIRYAKDLSRRISTNQMQKFALLSISLGAALMEPHDL